MDRVDAGALDRAADRGRQVAVADQLDPAPAGADLLDQRLVARSLEDHDGDVADAPPQLGGDPCEVLARRQADVDPAGRDRPDAELLEVRVGGVEEAALLGRGEDRDRAGLAVGDEVRALERVDGDVDRRVRIVRAGPPSGRRPARRSRASAPRRARPRR
jgi:hypothetical protein